MYLQPLWNKLLLVCVILSVPFICGCQQQLDCTVRGTVTLDGGPLPSGTISFIPQDGQSPSAGGLIEDGGYRLTLQPGTKTVRITASKVVGQQSPYEGDATTLVEVTEQILPGRYNAHSELSSEIVSGANTQDFDLTSQK